jgi:hypothetical protein
VEVSKSQVFLKKYYPGFYCEVVRKWSFDYKQMLKRTENIGWRFFQKPVGLELYFLKPELTFTFFLFIFFIAGCFLIGFFWDVSVEIGNQTPPSTARNEAKM